MYLSQGKLLIYFLKTLLKSNYKFSSELKIQNTIHTADHLITLNSKHINRYDKKCNLIEQNCNFT